MPLLSDLDPPAVLQINDGGSAPILFVSDHDSNAVPSALGDLGLPAAAFEEHIAYDIGIARIGRRLAARFDAPLIATGYSRLVCDCNRHPFARDSMPVVADGTPVGGNQGLSDADKRVRYEALFHPYHRAVADRLDRMIDGGGPPLLVALHSFTPALASGGPDRPWEVGFLWGDDDRATAPMIELFSAMHPKVCVGANQPYTGGSPVGYTVPIHGERRHLHNLTIEFRQDLVADDAGADLWADRFGDALVELLRRGLVG